MYKTQVVRTVFLSVILILLVILGGCLHYGISKTEAENIAIKYTREATGNPGTVLNSYKEGGYWNVVISQNKESLTFEINMQTGKLEYISGQGVRLNVDKLSKGR